MSSTSPPNLVTINFARAARGLGNLEAALLRAIDQAVIATDLDGTIIFWNRFAEELYGWKSEEVLGQNILEVTPTAQSREAAAEIMAQLQNGQSWSGEFDVRHKDGRWFAVHVTDTPLRDDNGVMLAIMGVSTPSPAKAAPSSRKMLPVDLVIRAKTALARLRSIKDEVQSARRRPGILGFTFGKRMEELFIQDRRVRSAGLALLFYSGAVLFRLALDQVVPERLPFITFFPAVLLASFFCGPWASFSVLVASAVTGAVWTEPPSGEILTFRMTLFALFGVIGGSLWAGVLYLKNVLNRLRQRDEQLALINREMKHRIKNVFAVMSSISVQTIKSSPTIETLAAALTGRINAIAAAQDVLSVVASEGSDLRSMVETLVLPVAPSPSRLRIEGPSTKLPSEATTTFALILHELATNAVKHGAWRLDRGQVTIEWRVHSDQELDFRWREHDGLPSAPAARQGLGSTLIKRGLNKAKVDHQITPHGLDCRIRLPLP